MSPGIPNVMQHLGMEDGAIGCPERLLACEGVQRVNPRNGGYLVAECRRNILGREVSEGERIGWQPRVSIDKLVRRMIEHDLEPARQERTLREAGQVVAAPGMAGV